MRAFQILVLHFSPLEKDWNQQLDTWNMWNKVWLESASGVNLDEVDTGSRSTERTQKIYKYIYGC